MEKTAKIISVQENVKQYPGKVGTVFIHKIRFEGDPENKIWEWHSSSEKCDKFKEGETTTFTTKINVRGQYTDYMIYPGGAKSFGGKKSFEEEKDHGVITFLSCLSSAATYYSQRESSWDDVLKATSEAYNKAILKSTKPKNYERPTN